MKKTTKKKYYLQHWNIMQLIVYLGNFYLVFQHSCADRANINWVTLVNSALICAFFTLSMLFYWTRGMPKLGFYTRLMIETVSDIKMFILLFVLVAITFADQIFILETYGRARDGYNYQ
jgi:hypothetical protein